MQPLLLQSLIIIIVIVVDAVGEVETRGEKTSGAHTLGHQPVLHNSRQGPRTMSEVEAKRLSFNQHPDTGEKKKKEHLYKHSQHGFNKTHSHSITEIS